MRSALVVLRGVAAVAGVCGCANQEATLVGGVAKAIDETFRTAGEVVRENPYQRGNETEAPETAQAPDGEEHYYRAEVLVKTRGQAKIEAMRLRDTEEVSEFW